jgi:hypothetical protein
MEITPPRQFESVVTELIQGLSSGQIILESPEEASAQLVKVVPRSPVKYQSNGR